MVRLRQALDTIRHRLQYIPLLMVSGAIVLSQVMLQIDGGLGDDQLPRALETTVDSGRAILSALAGGLITSITLLLSMMLVAVQLASSQFSPRTLRNWIGDRSQQLAIGLVLGTTVYCLLILRETRDFGEGGALTPHLSVILAVVLGIASLVAVVRSVDHLTNRLRIGSVASHLLADTVALIESDERLAISEHPVSVPIDDPHDEDMEEGPPSDAIAITATESGWVQQIDSDAILSVTPDGSTTYVTISVGAFAFEQAPLAWISPDPDDDVVGEGIAGAIALGDTRTMQQDIGFGILQMVDIAVRALSPGVNDPNSANDIIVHLGAVLLKLWERPVAPTVQTRDGRTLVRHDLTHADYLQAAFDPIRLYGCGDPRVAATLIRTLLMLLEETKRRELPGPAAPIDEAVAQIRRAVDESGLSDDDKALVRSLS